MVCRENSRLLQLHQMTILIIAFYLLLIQTNGT
nr:MAG TPA: hypothetical protein [Caudoviricetes sp.]DAX75100.1 MAG TPA: hypothetical protein [Caudoviricetes sp.]